VLMLRGLGHQGKAGVWEDGEKGKRGSDEKRSLEVVPLARAYKKKEAKNGPAATCQSSRNKGRESARNKSGRGGGWRLWLEGKAVRSSGRRKSWGATV